MPVARTTTVVASPAAAAETSIANLTGLTLSTDDQLDFFVALDVTIGTAGATLTWRVRHSMSVTGALIQAYGPFTVAATNRYSFSGMAFQQVGGEQFNAARNLTLQVGSATATSTVNGVYFELIY